MEGKALLKLRRTKTGNIQNLHIENYEVLHCEYTLNKDTTTAGEVNSGVRAGNIVVALPILPNDNIMAWVFDGARKYDGEITIHDAFQETLEKITFEEGRPVEFRFHYEPGSITHTVVLLSISAQRITVGGGWEYVNSFK